MYPLSGGRQLSRDNAFQLYRISRCIENRAVITGILDNSGQVCNDCNTKLFCGDRSCICKTP